MAKASRDDLQRAIERVEKVTHCSVAGDKIRERARVKKRGETSEPSVEEVEGGALQPSTTVGQLPGRR